VRKAGKPFNFAPSGISFPGPPSKVRPLLVRRDHWNIGQRPGVRWSPCGQVRRSFRKDLHKGNPLCKVRV
jgi:hypothetical protein